MYRVQFLRFLVLSGLVATAACSSPEAAPSTVVSDSADVTLVTNSDGTLPSARLVEQIRIGAIDGDPAYLFDRVVSVSVGPRGHIVVVNGGSATVRVFEPDGTFSHEFGGRGGGPGEAIICSREIWSGTPSFSLEGAPAHRGPSSSPWLETSFTPGRSIPRIGAF